MTDSTWETEKKARGVLATQQQRRASDPLHSVWVEASAGTGKTKVLSDRVLRLLLQGVPPAKILCLTYTKAAAVEMSNRIAQKLSQWSVIDDAELDKQLTALLGTLPEQYEAYEQLTAMARRLFALLLDTPGGMKIQTLHSFCQDVLKRFPLEAKVSPYFEVMDDRAKHEILNQLQTDMLIMAQQNHDLQIGEAIGYLTSHVSEFTFPDIMHSITENAGKIVRLSQSYPETEDLLKVLASRLNILPSDTEEHLKDAFLRQLDRTSLKQMVQAWAQGSKSDLDKATPLYPLLERPWQIDDFDVLHQVFLNKDGSIPAKFATKKVLELYPALPAEAQKICEDLLRVDNQAAAVRVYASTKAIIVLAKEIITRYQDYKFSHAKMDYDDLILLTRNLLENRDVSDWVLFKLDGGIDHVLIDEAQDTSPNQWAIIRSLTQDFFDESRSERTVFVVGDRKQSIYSFQGADPREFENMRRYFKGRSVHFDEINLDISFRSTAAVLDAVNTVFANEVAKQGVLPEGQSMMHIPFRSGDGGRIEIWPIIEAQKDENPDMWLPPVERKVSESTSSRLARKIAQEIKKRVGHDMLRSQGRPLKYRDFMILVQRRNAFVDELVRECKIAGVAVAGVDKIKLREQVAVQDLIALGQFLLLPTDDLTLAVVLKSPLFGLNDDDLFKLCYHRGQAALWSRLGDDETYEKIYRSLQNLLNMTDYVRPFELYSYVLGKMGGRRQFEERMGSEVDDGLDEFINLTLTFEQEHIPTLQEFISWIGQDEVEIKRELEQGELDAVRIMTVHGSKGLQAPVVVLPDTVRQVNNKKGMGMLWEDIFYYPLSSADYEANCLRLKNQEKQDEAEEYRRLLYVALTRAEDCLCLCGYAKKTKPQPDCWYELCAQQLSQIGTQDGDNIVYETPQYNTPKAEPQQVSTRQTVYYPDWLKEEALAESPLAKPYTPSKPEVSDDDDALFSPLGHEDNHRYRRGTVIHKLLQFLPDVQSVDKMPVIEDYLRQNAADFSEAQRTYMATEVYRLINDERFAPLFGKNSKAEVPIMGRVGDVIVSAQVDRLVVLDDEVWVVDYKTNRPAAKTEAEVKQGYVMQLSAYKSLLQQIYPDKKVRTFLLWTDTAQMMQIVS